MINRQSTSSNRSGILIIPAQRLLTLIYQMINLIKDYYNQQTIQKNNREHNIPPPRTLSYVSINKNKILILQTRHIREPLIVTPQHIHIHIHILHLKYLPLLHSLLPKHGLIDNLSRLAQFRPPSCMLPIQINEI